MDNWVNISIYHFNPDGWKKQLRTCQMQLHSAKALHWDQAKVLSKRVSSIQGYNKAGCIHAVYILLFFTFQRIITKGSKSDRYNN